MNRMTDVNNSENDTSVNEENDTQPEVDQHDDAALRMQQIINKPIHETTAGSFSVDNSNYWEIKDIPTNYRLYPEGTVIKARPLKVIEVKKLSSMNDSNADYVINDILKRTVQGINVDDIYLADKIYIVFWLRANTFRDSSYVIDFACPKCEKESKYNFQLSNLKINDLKDDYNPSKVITMDNGDGVTMRYLTIKDEIMFDRFKELNENTLEEIDDELLGLSCMINTINGKSTDDMLERYNYVLNVLSPGDFSTLSTYVEEYGIGIDPVMNVTCLECGGNAPMGVTFRPDFFLPKRSA